MTLYLEVREVFTRPPSPLMLTVEFRFSQGHLHFRPNCSIWGPQEHPQL